MPDGGAYGHAWAGALDGMLPYFITAEDFAGNRSELGPERGWRHLWVNLASYTMGQGRDGPRALPERLWPFFSGCFTGTRISPLGRLAGIMSQVGLLGSSR